MRLAGSLPLKKYCQPFKDLAMNKNNTEVKVLIGFGLICLVVACIYTGSWDDFTSTARGVAYEGLIFASLLALLLNYIKSEDEELRKRLKLQEKKQARDSLIKILSILCEAYSKGGVFHWTKLIKNADSFEINFRAFKDAKAKKRNEMQVKLSEKFFKNTCEHNLLIVLSHIPIAEKISSRHLDIWVGICSIVSLTAEDAVFPDHLIDEFEQHITEFCKLNVTVSE